MPTDPPNIAMLIARDIAQQQAACQLEIDAANAAMRAFLRGTAEGDIQPYIKRILIAEMRMAMIPWDVEEDYCFLYGLDAPTQGILRAH